MDFFLKRSRMLECTMNTTCASNTFNDKYQSQTKYKYLYMRQLFVERTRSEKSTQTLLGKNIQTFAPTLCAVGSQQWRWPLAIVTASSSDCGGQRMTGTHQTPDGSGMNDFFQTILVINNR